MLGPVVAAGNLKCATELKLQPWIGAIRGKGERAGPQPVANVDQPVGHTRHHALRIVGIGGVEIAVVHHRLHSALGVGHLMWPDAEGLVDRSLASLLKDEFGAGSLIGLVGRGAGSNRRRGQCALEVDSAIGQRGNCYLASLGRLRSIFAVWKHLGKAREILRIGAFTDEVPQNLIEG